MKLLILSISALALFSCAKHKTEAIDPVNTNCMDTISFNTKILPLFETNCTLAGCHNQSAASSGYIFETHGQISGDAEIALKTIKHMPNVSSMPQNAPKLNDSLIQFLECWIAQGKLNN